MVIKELDPLVGEIILKSGDDGLKYTLEDNDEYSVDALVLNSRHPKNQLLSIYDSEGEPTGKYYLIIDATEREIKKVASDILSIQPNKCEVLCSSE